MERYGELHNHSEYSLNDSGIKIADLPKKAKELGNSFVALTDHGNLCGIPYFLDACKEHDIKGIIGVEGYLSYSLKDIRINSDISVEAGHILLLAKNKSGYDKISKIVTKSNNRIDSKGRPIISLSDLTLAKNDVFVLTGCMGGFVNKILLVNDFIEKEISKCKKKASNLASRDDTDYVKLASKLEKLNKDIEAMTEKKKALSVIAKKKYSRIEQTISRMEEGSSKVEAMQKLNADKEESVKAEKEIISLLNKIKELKESVKSLKKEIEFYEKSFVKLDEITKKIDSLESKKIPYSELENYAKNVLIYFKDIFKDNFFVEIQYHGIEGETKCMPVMVKLAKELCIPIVATNDSHMLDNSKESIKARQIMRSLKYNVYEEVSESDKELYLKTEKELRHILSQIITKEDIDEAIKNISFIADKCNVIFEKEEHYPKYVSSIPGESSNDALKRISYENIPWRFPNKDDFTEEYKKRLDYELKVICQMGYADYHLIVQDFLQVGRKMGKLTVAKLNILKENIQNWSLDEIYDFLDKNQNEVGLSIGPGRGSAAGSLVCYLLGITSLDPIKYGLLFERFLNPERVSMPDIDSDFSMDVRGLVLEYVKKKYGKEAVCQICTDMTMAAKGSIRDCARIYGSQLGDSKMFLSLADEISKSFPPKITKFGDDINGISCYEFLTKKFKDNGNALKILRDAKIVEGLVKGHGMHAAGVIISDNADVSDYVPLMYNSDANQWVCQCDAVNAETKGLLKMDFLGLKNLNIITDAARLIRKRHGIELDLENLPFDEKVFENIYAKGFTNGVFQVESDGMKNMFKKLKPSSIEDVILGIAAYRPGPMEFIPDIIAVKNKTKKPEYVIPEMEEVLGVTYGYPIYQEQLMEIFHRFANFSLGEADIVRRYMSKKKVDKFMAFKPKFIDGLVKNGADRKKAELFWETLEDFAKYAFNKSHAAVYAFVSYITAYLKYHFPTEFITSALNYTELDSISNLVKDCDTLGIKILCPDINKSEAEFSINDDCIIFGLGNIKGVGKDGSLIISEREKNDFDSFKDFLLRSSADRGSITSLIWTGAFDIFTENRKALELALDTLMDLRKCIRDTETKIAEGEKILRQLQDGETNIQSSTFKKLDESLISEKIKTFKESLNDKIKDFLYFEIPTDVSIEPSEIRENEKKYMNIYLSSNPIDDYVFPNTSICTAEPTKSASLAGIISDLRIVNQKKDGRELAFFTLEDKTGFIKVNCFADDYEKFKEVIKSENGVVINGSIREEKIYGDEEGTELKLTVKNISELKKIKKTVIVYANNLKDYHLNIEPILKKNKDENGNPVKVFIKMDSLLFDTTYTVNEEIKKNLKTLSL